jgi:purine-cytosine permease-like protein
LSLRFSDKALRQAEQTWDQFDGDYSRANAITASLTAVVLIAFLAVLIGFCVRYFMGVPLEQAAGDLAGHSQQVRASAGDFAKTSQSLAASASELPPPSKNPARPWRN